MDFEAFYDLVVYGNDNWKGGMSGKELAMNAFELYNDYQYSVENKTLSTNLVNLVGNLLDDACNEYEEVADTEEMQWVRKIIESVR